MSIFFVGQDLRITLVMGIDITGATCKIKYRNPSGGTGYWTGTISVAATGEFYYDAVPANLVLAGLWTLWAHAVLTSGKVAIGRPCKILISAEGT
jgi:hypothetical protein